MLLFLQLRRVSIYYSRLHSSSEIIKSYAGSPPLSAWLKQWFSKNRKYGSRDRKEISALCYSYYRLGKWAQSAPGHLHEKLLAAHLLCNTTPTPLLEALKPDWLHMASAGTAKKMAFLESQGIPISGAALFPWQQRLTKGIDADAFTEAMTEQPDLFIRIRPGHTAAVMQRLKENGVSFQMRSEDGIALPNGTDVRKWISVNKEAVVQDYNSQRIASLLRKVPIDAPNTWDCCAASGGKSILAIDTLHNPLLTVSDIRSSILINLKKRFAEAGIGRYHAAQINLEHPPLRIANAPFDLVICDAPCSGSGTWGRTPEQLYFFEEKKIADFSRLQQTIAGNAAVFLKHGGYFLYITCSVFSDENEAIVQHLQNQHGLTLQSMQVLKGYHMRADTLFGALFVKP